MFILNATLCPWPYPQWVTGSFKRCDDLTFSSLDSSPGTHTHTPISSLMPSPVSLLLSCEFLPLGPRFPPCCRGRHTHIRTLAPAQCSFHGHHSTWSLKPGIHRLSIYFLSQPSLISFMLSCFSHVWLFATLWTTACQAPLSGSLQDTVHRIFYRTCHGDLY